MASKKKTRNVKTKRPTQEYLDAAKRLSKFVPKLAKLKRRKTLTTGEKSYITKAENALRWVDNLRPLTKVEAKQLKGATYEGAVNIPEKYKMINGERIVTREAKSYPFKGVRAIQMKNISPDAKIKIIKDKQTGKYKMQVVSNGRTFDYLKPRNTSPEEMLALAEKLFADPTVKEIYLWTSQGRVGQGFGSVYSFMEWFNKSYHGYKNTEKWVKGFQVDWVSGIAARKSPIRMGRERINEYYLKKIGKRWCVMLNNEIIRSFETKSEAQKFIDEIERHAKQIEDEDDEYEE